MKKNQKTLIATKLPPYSDGHIHRPLTKRELEEYSQLSGKTIDRAIDSGELKAVRAGKSSVRFRPADIDRWLKEVDPDEPGYFHGTRPQDMKAKSEVQS